MQQSCKSKRVDIDKIIIKALRRGDKTIKELKDIVVIGDMGKSYDTFNRHKNNLIKRGIITKAEHRLIVGIDVEEADKEVVSDYLKAMKGEEDSKVLEFILKGLSTLAPNNRIASLPNVLAFCESALEDNRYHEQNVLEKLIYLCNRIIWFERHYKPRNYEKKIDRIENEILNSINKISKKEMHYNVLREIISFYKYTDKKESVESLFEIFENISDDLFKKLYSTIEETLFRRGSILKKTQKRLIDTKIIELLKSKNQQIRKRAVLLSEKSY